MLKFNLTGGAILNISLKESLKYFIYTIGFLILLIIISQINLQFERIYQETFKIYPWHVFAILMYMLIGIYLGILNFIKVLNKKGKWRINFNKLLFIGLPMLYITFYHYFPFSYPIPSLLIHTNTLFRFGIIIFGYILIDSLYKND